MSATATQIQLKSRPHGWPTASNFRQVEVTLPALADGEVRVRNEFISVDPYMRGRMRAGRSYVAPYELDAPLSGGAVGRVVASNVATLPTGTLVRHGDGWRDLTQGPASHFQAVPELPGAPSSLHLGLLGMPGLTAYVGLREVAGLRAGDRVFVSGAAGAVGTAAGQFAQLLGAAELIGSAGSAEKVALLVSKYGYDKAFNYKDAPVRDQLRKLAGGGIDVYFDNVGGDHLEAAIDVFNDHGRAAICGAISQYNATAPTPGPDNLALLVQRRLTLRGFIVGELTAARPELVSEFGQQAVAWLSAGKLVYDETVRDGLDHAVDAFIEMLGGANVGKMVVKI